MRSIPKPNGIGPKITSTEQALAMLQPRPQGWRANHGGKYIHRPKQVQLKIAWRLQYLREKWHREHPGQQMTLDKLNSLRANSTNWALHAHNHIRKVGQRFYQKARARRFLRAQKLAAFRAKPALAKTKRLPI